MDDIEKELMQDFMLYLDLCKNPDSVFGENSPHATLTRLWLEKLCRYECDDLNDRRIRNVYMSYLVVCLNKKKLTGPFLLKPPDGKLETTDFTIDHCAPPEVSETVAAKACCPRRSSARPEQCPPCPPCPPC